MCGYVIDEDDDADLRDLESVREIIGELDFVLAFDAGGLSSYLFFIVEFQWFLIALSDLPGKYLAISAHLLPICMCKSNSNLSSVSVHAVFLISGFK